MVQYYWEQVFWIIVGQGECIGVVDIGVGDFYQYFVFFWWGDVDFDDLQWLVGIKGDGGMGFYGGFFRDG